MKKEESISPKRTIKGKQFIAEEVSTGSKTTVHTTTRKTSAELGIAPADIIPKVKAVVKVSKRPNYDALSNEVKKLHNMALSQNNFYDSESEKHTLLFISNMQKFFTTHAMEVIDAKYKDLQLNAKIKFESKFDQLEKYDILYNQMIQKIQNSYVVIRDKEYNMEHYSNVLAALEYYNRINKVFNYIFNDDNLRYDNKWLIDELNSESISNKLLKMTFDSELEILKTSKHKISVAARRHALILKFDKKVSETKIYKTSQTLCLIGGEITLHNDILTHNLNAKLENLAIAKLPLDFTYMLSYIFGAIR